MAFTGWPAEAIDFFDGLEEDNSRTYWQAHKTIYERAVKGPMDLLLADLAGEFGVHHCRLLERVLLIATDESVATLLVADRGPQTLPPATLAVLLPRADTHPDVNGERRGQRATEQVRQPRRVGRQRRGREMDRLLQRPVGVAQPRRVLADIDPGRRVLADHLERPVAQLRGVLERGRRRNLARAGKPLEQPLLLGLGELGGGVKALPQQRERRGAVQQPRVDASAA